MAPGGWSRLVSLQRRKLSLLRLSEINGHQTQRSRCKALSLMWCILIYIIRPFDHRRKLSASLTRNSIAERKLRNNVLTRVNISLCSSIFHLYSTVCDSVRLLSVKKALSIRIIGPFSPKAFMCKNFGWPLSIGLIGPISKNDAGSNALTDR